jgi:hypothetical protein
MGRCKQPARPGGRRAGMAWGMFPGHVQEWPAERSTDRVWGSNGHGPGTGHDHAARAQTALYGLGCSFLLRCNFVNALE